MPDGRRTGPARREMDGRAGRRRPVWSALGVAAAVGLLVVSLKPSLLPGDPLGSAGAQATAASPLTAETAARTGAPEKTDAQTPTLDRPFAGSPALRWADGATGIAPPAAKAVGSMSEERVAQALELTKKLLIGANLDPGTLRGDRPKAALSLLDPEQPDLLDDLNASLRSPGREHDPVSLFTRFDPDEIQVVGEVVKTRGHMTFEKGKHAGVAVHADYTFVYPVSRADGSTEVTRTIVRRVLDVELADPARYQVTDGRLLLLQYDQEIANSACDVYDGFLHPEFSSTTPTGPEQTGPAVDPYDRSKGIQDDSSEGCGTVSRV